MSNKKIGVGIVGLSAKGGWAATAHVPALRSLANDYTIVGLSASTKDSAHAAAEKYGVAFSTDNPAELAARQDVDLMVITVKVPFHRQLVEAAILAGKNVYCEWPLGNGLGEAEYLADLARLRGVRTFVGLQARSAPVIRYLRDLVSDGYVGKVQSTTLIASGGSPWNGTATRDSAYATDKTTGATMLTIPFGHTLDAVCWTLGAFGNAFGPLSASLATRNPVVNLSDADRAVYASGPDQIAVSGVLNNGVFVAAHFRGNRSRGNTNFLWEINGTRGDLVVTGGSGHLQFGMVKLQGGQGDFQSLTDLPVPAKYVSSSTSPNSLEHNVAHAYTHLLDDLRRGSRQLPDFDDAAATHRLLDRIERTAV